MLSTQNIYFIFNLTVSPENCKKKSIKFNPLASFHRCEIFTNLGYISYFDESEIQSNEN
jgi:hypothetical protein